MTVCKKCHKAITPPPVTPSPSETNEIKSYFHCHLCLQEAGDNAYSQDIEVGFTKEGIQVWCRQHQISITHLIPNPRSSTEKKVH